MYLKHFGLSQTPFSLTPNTGFFFGLSPHVEALQVLQTALQTGEGFIKVTGEVGTGKTLLCRKLINDLPSGFHCAYLPNPYLTPAELRWAVANELGLHYGKDIDQQQLTGLIQQQLLELSSHGQAIVLVLDEAQALPDDSLEALRLFTNLETESRKLLQVVLFGQPELDERLKRQEFRQLRQRITFSYNLRPLTWDETDAYIRYRLAIAGRQGEALFTPKLTRKIANASRGIPRLINILAHKALLLSFGEGVTRVKASHVRDAILDTEDASKNSFWSRSMALVLALLTVFIFAIAASGIDFLQIWGNRA
ncbi:AAA family ATPase [Shewanella sp. JNE10-2]|uniref:ExeA family protein n=1 Tax=unclassified Shewanella TaxID=196818 RepID=UPI00005FBD01|nr:MULTISPECIES: AAA family ATPase [unclassified Shewanella]ABM26420.1 MSHA biogenesis protein MshM [Shewanella sp. W3-18-1]MCK7630855.1 AAA family ATPase [Shewanella sp. JNE9-1]MCK7635453.1 AAA family ATPase [Shewanella sp. JNE17]MCK7646108.1 AAA family ATPase [Shewanella sp. JNE3-1]MCK7650679.1 AAA family ATPase [Shewanella sp. JNE8]